MTTIQDPSPIGSQLGAGGTKGKNSTQETQDRFLSLLVAQMKNQDPLNPLDNAQVTSQLAQLSTVQGIEKMNASLTALANSLGGNQMAQAAHLIGRNVLVPGDNVSQGAGQGVMAFEIARPADKVVLSIVDANGIAVRKLDLGPREAGLNVLTWDGLTDSGAKAPAGVYQFRIDAIQGGQPLSAVKLNLGTVNSVSQGGQGVSLNLSGNKSVGYADIRQIF